MTVVNLKKEKKRALIKEVQGFFHDEHDKEIGILAAETVLEFFDEKLGVAYYNKAHDDSKKWFSDRMENLEYDYEFFYK